MLGLKTISPELSSPVTDAPIPLQKLAWIVYVLLLIKYIFGSGVSLLSIPNLTYNWPSRKGAQLTSFTVAKPKKVSASGTEVAPSINSIGFAKLSGASVGILLNSVTSSIPSPS